MLLGFALALVVGLGFAVAPPSRSWPARHLPPARRLSDDPDRRLRADPRVWLGFGIWPKLVIVALVCFFPITVATSTPCARSTRRGKDDALSRRLGLAVVPAAGRADRSPRFFSGAKIAAPFAPSAPSSARPAGSSSGLGHLILQDNAQLETARMFAAVAVLSAMAHGPLRPDRTRGAAHRHLAIESRG